MWVLFVIPEFPGWGRCWLSLSGSWAWSHAASKAGARSSLPSSLPNALVGGRGIWEGADPFSFIRLSSGYPPGDYLLHFVSGVNGPWDLNKCDWTSLHASAGPSAVLRGRLLSWLEADPEARVIDINVASLPANALSVHFPPIVASSPGCYK